MNRIDRIFTDLRAANGRALMPYITAGDPDVATLPALLAGVERAGAAICEIGFPFSDPIADGPVIQASMTYALDHGAKISAILDAVKQARAGLKLGIVAMTSYSIVHKLGVESFIARSKAAGFDGFIFPDLPVEESDDALKLVRDAGMIASMLIAPTTPIERAEKIARASTGFVYVLSRAGITGERSDLPPDLAPRIPRLRGVTKLPIAVGFGVSTPGHVKQVVSVADAAIVGSAIMRRVAEKRAAGSAAVVAEIERFTRELAGGLR